MSSSVVFVLVVFVFGVGFVSTLEDSVEKKGGPDEGGLDVD